MPPVTVMTSALQVGHLYLSNPDRLEVVFSAMGMGVPNPACLGTSATDSEYVDSFLLGDEDSDVDSESELDAVRRSGASAVGRVYDPPLLRAVQAQPATHCTISGW